MAHVEDINTVMADLMRETMYAQYLGSVADPKYADTHREALDKLKASLEELLPDSLAERYPQFGSTDSKESQEWLSNQIIIQIERLRLATNRLAAVLND